MAPIARTAKKTTGTYTKFVIHEVRFESWSDEGLDVGPPHREVAARVGIASGAHALFGAHQPIAGPSTVTGEDLEEVAGMFPGLRPLRRGAALPRARFGALRENRGPGREPRGGPPGGLVDASGEVLGVP